MRNDVMCNRKNIVKVVFLLTDVTNKCRKVNKTQTSQIFTRADVEHPQGKSILIICTYFQLEVILYVVFFLSPLEHG